MKLLETGEKILIQEMERLDTAHALFIIDIDNFRKILAHLDEETCDIIIKKALERIQSNSRSIDHVIHLGQDQFAMLMTFLEEHADLGVIAERIINMFSKPFIIDERLVDLSVSIGISQYPLHHEDSMTLFQYAKIALYFAKSIGTSSAVIFSQTMNDNVEEKSHLIDELKKAINEKEFRIHYQAHVDSKANAIVGAEALLRWQHPNKVMYLPKDYLIVAQESGLMPSIENWIISEVFQQIHIWRRMRQIKIPVSINLSQNHLREKVFLTHLEKLLAMYDINPSQVIFEIPEHALLDPESQNSINALNELGFGLCVDDFKANALKYIHDNPIKQIKLDKSFIDGIFNNNKDETIISVITTLSKEIGIQIIAKGVENQDQIDFLKQMGCYVIQGYFYSKPLDIGDFEDYILVNGTSQ